jgi:hypothetical protein
MKPRIEIGAKPGDRPFAKRQLSFQTALPSFRQWHWLVRSIDLDIHVGHDLEKLWKIRAATGRREPGFALERPPGYTAKMP